MFRLVDENKSHRHTKLDYITGKIFLCEIIGTGIEQNKKKIKELNTKRNRKQNKN